MVEKRVLVVDDIPENIHLMSSMLRHKYIVSASTSGEKAIELAKSEPKPDIILLDVYMPGMSGFEVCQRLREDSATKDIPILFVTSMDDGGEFENTINCEKDIGFIKKPVTRELMVNKIESYLSIKEDNIVVEKKDVVMQEKSKILVVDDTPETIKVIVEILKESYIVSVATSGEKALSVLEDGLEPDLILLDIIMPEMDGFQVCEKLKVNEKYKDIPVMFLTVLENEQDIVRGFEIGAVDYVTKPVEPTVLKARVKTHLKLRAYQKELLKSLSEKEELILKQSKLATLGEMFENVTHQWKQPLSVITLATDTIKMTNELGQLNTEKLEINLDAVKDSTIHLAQTIDDFRDFFKEDVKKQYFNIKDVIGKTLKLLSAKFKNQEIVIDKDELEDIEILAYKNDLIQVLMNIFNNAKDALENIDTNRIIKVSTKKENDQLIIKVLDNAGGIKDEHFAKLFDKYFTTKAKDKGTGLGLHMSKCLVEEHLDGCLKAYNENNGACFEIQVPIKNL